MTSPYTNRVFLTSVVHAVCQSFKTQNSKVNQMSRVDPPYDQTNPRHSCHAMVQKDPVTEMPAEPVAMCKLCQNYVYFPVIHLESNGGYCTMCAIRRGGYESKRGKTTPRRTSASVQPNADRKIKIPFHTCNDIDPKKNRPRCRCESSVEWIVMRCDPRSTWRFWPVTIEGRLSMGIPAFSVDTWRPEHTELLRKTFKASGKFTDSCFVKVVSNVDFVKTQMQHSDDPILFIAALKKCARVRDTRTQEIVH